MKLIQKNGIDIVIENKKDTPRTAVCLSFAINKEEKFSGIYSLFTKLLLGGTKTKNAQELAEVLESNGIEVSIKCKQDFLRVSALFLNEDLSLAVENIKDMLLNSTFENFEKEAYKLKGEIISDLDSPQLKASDAFIREVFKNHYYGNTHTKTLEDLSKIKKEDVASIHKQLLASKKVITVVGDFEDENKMVEYFLNNFSFMTSSDSTSEIEDVTSIKEEKTIKIPKDDAKQAQIIKGYIVGSYYKSDYPKIVVMNNILGSSGLSSRLFVELRDKQGLAYTVRSSLEPLKHSTLFYFYIGTSPKNIKKSLDCFDIEVQKLIDEPPTMVELEGAKENLMGRLEYFSQTNAQVASVIGYDYIMNLGLDYEEKYKAMIKAVSAQDVSDMAKKYLMGKSVTSILAPEKYLDF